MYWGGPLRRDHEIRASLGRGVRVVSARWVGSVWLIHVSEILLYKRAGGLSVLDRQWIVAMLAMELLLLPAFLRKWKNRIYGYWFSFSTTNGWF